MATHSSMLAWKISRTEEPVGYSPWGRKESDMSEYINAPTSVGNLEHDVPVNYGIIGLWKSLGSDE